MTRIQQLHVPLGPPDQKLTSSACAMKFSAVCVSTMLDDGEDILSALLLFQTVWELKCGF